MAGTDDDDPAADWPAEAAPTTLDRTVVAAADPITAPHDLTALVGSEEAIAQRALDGRFRAVYAEGQEDAMGALRHVLLERGLTNEETAHVVLAVKQRLTPL